MFWSWIAARLSFYALRQKRGFPSSGTSHGDYSRLVLDPRRFFECATCGYFHEEAIQINCAFVPNQWTLGTMPVGGPTATEVLFLDGRVEYTPKDLPRTWPNGKRIDS